MSINWVTFMGDFEQPPDGKVVFKGRNLQQGEETGSKPLVGKILSDQSFDGGEIRAKVLFEAPQKDSIAELIVYSDLASENMLTAGLGADGYFYGVRFWNQGQSRWQPSIAKGGSSNSLRPNHTYDLQISLKGSNLSMKVDGVRVCAASLPFQPSRSQVGILCISSSEITITDFSVEPLIPMVFIVMPFSPKYDQLYEHVIKPVCNSFNVRPHRVDETSGPGVIIADIVQQIRDAKIVIADITPNPANPNVYYEVGYSHAIGKPTILVADRSGTDKLPFDVSPFRVLFYEDSIGGKKKVESELARHLESILRESPATYSPS